MAAYAVLLSANQTVETGQVLPETRRWSSVSRERVHLLSDHMGIRKGYPGNRLLLEMRIAWGRLMARMHVPLPCTRAASGMAPWLGDVASDHDMFESHSAANTARNSKWIISLFATV